MTKDLLNALVTGTEQNALYMIATFMYLLETSKNGILSLSEYIEQKRDLENLDCVVYDETTYSYDADSARIISTIAVDSDGNYIAGSYFDELFANTEISVSFLRPEDIREERAIQLSSFEDGVVNLFIRNGKVLHGFWNRRDSIFKELHDEKQQKYYL